MKMKKFIHSPLKSLAFQNRDEGGSVFRYRKLQGFKALGSFILILGLIFVFIGSISAQEEEKWQIEKSTHFIVYYKNAPADFIQKAINESERHYNQIAQALGFMRFNFWLWDKRAVIYIYDDIKSYQLATKQPDWSSGSVRANDKIIYTYINAESFFDNILPHEIGHIIFREFVGFNNQAVPIWLEEGVASYQEDLKNPELNLILKKSLSDNSFIDFSKLNTLNPLLLNSKEEVVLFYAESVSIVGFLIKEFGSDRFAVFCQDLRDKKNLIRAISGNYPFSTLKELGDTWQGYIKAK